MRHAIMSLLVLLSISIATSEAQSKPLSNDDVIQMIGLGLSDDVILEKIRSATATNFDTSTAGLKTLKAAKASDAVLKTIIDVEVSHIHLESPKKPDQDDGSAENNTGYMYFQGRGVTQDFQQAMVWFRKAADQHNNASAESNLGWMYENGIGVDQDYEQAVSWYRKAAQQGNVAGQFNLGWMYQHALGVNQDYKQAVIWYRKAADQGNVSGENQLGMLYKDGNGVPRDDQQAAMWFRKAADQGAPTAQLNLGWMYANGRGMAQDYEEALALYRKAADHGGNVQPYLDELPLSVRAYAATMGLTGDQASGAVSSAPASAASGAQQSGMTPSAQSRPSSPFSRTNSNSGNFPVTFEVLNWTASADGEHCEMQLSMGGATYLVSNDYTDKQVHFKECPIHTSGEAIRGRIANRWFGKTIELLGFDQRKSKYYAERWYVEGTSR